MTAATLSMYPGLRRSGLFGFVVGAHALLLVALTLARSPLPVVEEQVMLVELLPMAPAAQGVADMPPARAKAPVQRVPEKPRPVRPQKPAVTPVIKAPQLEPQPNAIAEPIASAPESAAKPAADASASAGNAGGSSREGASGGGVKNGSASGSGESLARFDADYLRNPAPPYPPLSRKLHESGKVVLRVLVTPEGTAASLEVRTSSGSARLDDSALRTVRHWKFIPARRGDVPVQSWVLVPVIFTLE